jgi:glycosyltransferase involved in cell wall biosynthesis
MVLSIATTAVPNCKLRADAGEELDQLFSVILSNGQVIDSVKLRAEILIFSPSVSGGVAEHTFYQARALEKAGAKVVCLVGPSFLAGRPTGFETVMCLKGPPVNKSPRWLKKLKMLWCISRNRLVLAVQIWKRRPGLVLLDSYVEYVAPLWVWPHWLLARIGRVRYAANLHDPVRNFQLGPAWWHRLSVRLAYLPLDFVLVHDKLPEPSPVPTRVRVVQVPHGLYEISGPPLNAEEIRQSWGVKEGQKVFLSFGFVRDGKNLDLAVRAVAQVMEVFLVVAGSVASAKDKPFAYYRELAARLGILDRCLFAEGFVADNELGKYFAGTDFVLLTYSASFHSQSGVLNLAARARKPVLASGSPSPLIEAIRKFKLGITVEPDSAAAIVNGMKQLLSAPPPPCWEEYEIAASWPANAQGVLRAAGLEAKAESGK